MLDSVASQSNKMCEMMLAMRGVLVRLLRSYLILWWMNALDSGLLHELLMLLGSRAT